MFELENLLADIREDLILYYYEHLTGDYFDHSFCSALHKGLCNSIESGSLPENALLNLVGGDRMQIVSIICEAEERMYGRPLTFKERARQNAGEKIII
jgi:hypothetical protein